MASWRVGSKECKEEGGRRMQPRHGGRGGRDTGRRMGTREGACASGSEGSKAKIVITSYISPNESATFNFTFNM